MIETFREFSPRLTARMAGLSQLLEGFTATFPQLYVLDKLVVPGNAASTAANILGHEPLFIVGFALAACGVVFHLAWAFLLYELLRPVSTRLSLFALLVMVVGCAVQALSVFLYLAPLLILKGNDSMGAFTAEQLQQLAHLFVRLNTYGFDLYLVFFGFWCVLVGSLIARSTFMPRMLGLFLMISGVGWTMYLSPWFAMAIFPYIAAASALGEIPLELWLLIKGVNAHRWHAQASAAGLRRVAVDV
jgi:hypothetical protein